MSQDLETQLRSSLRRVDPEPGFAQRVLARIDAEQRRHGARRSSWLPVRLSWLPGALAACVIGGAVVNVWRLHHESQGLEARQQVLEALRVTGNKLDLAYRVLNSPVQPPAADAAARADSGA